MLSTLKVTCARIVKADEAMSCRELFGCQLPLPQALEKDFNAAKQAFNGDLLTLQACKSLSIASAWQQAASFRGTAQEDVILFLSSGRVAFSRWTPEERAAFSEPRFLRRHFSTTRIFWLYEHLFRRVGRTFCFCVSLCHPLASPLC